jgi:hypothetical protein
LGFDFPGEITIILSPPAVRMKEKRTVPTRNYTQPGRLQTQMIDRPAEKEIRFQKERLSLWVTFRSDLFNGFFFYYLREAHVNANDDDDPFTFED